MRADVASAMVSDSGDLAMLLKLMEPARLAADDQANRRPEIGLPARSITCSIHDTRVDARHQVRAKVVGVHKKGA